PTPTLLPYTTLFRSGDVLVYSRACSAHRKGRLPQNRSILRQPGFAFTRYASCVTGLTGRFNHAIPHTSDRTQVRCIVANSLANKDRKSTRLNSSHVS